MREWENERIRHSNAISHFIIYKRFHIFNKSQNWNEWVLLWFYAFVVLTFYLIRKKKNKKKLIWKEKTTIEYALLKCTAETVIKIVKKVNTNLSRSTVVKLLENIGTIALVAGTKTRFLNKY